MANPSIVTGARGPRDTRPPVEKSDPVQVVSAIPENEAWFQARYSRLRIQLTAPQDLRLPDGRIKIESPIVAQFEQAMLKLNLNNEKDRKIKELLDEHPKKDVMFWDFQDALDQMATQQREAALTPLRDPKQRALIIEALKAEGVDFELPTARQKSSKKGEA